MLLDLLGVALIAIGLISAFARGRAAAQSNDPYHLDEPCDDSE